MLLLAVLAMVNLGGCLGIGNDFDPGEGDFWWDDQNKKRLDRYQLPPEADEPEPEREGGEASPLEAEQEQQARPSTNPKRESTATVIPHGQP